MKIEQVIKTTTTLSESKKALLNLVFTQNIVSERLNEIFRNFEISAEQFNVLRILNGQKGKPANMFLIQERMLAKTSNTTRLVDKLLQKKLVTRNVCPANRRKIEVEITTEGKILLTQMDPKINQTEEIFASNLTPSELAQLNILLEKYRNQ